MANGKNGESYDALVPIALVGVAAVAAYMVLSRTQGGPGTDLLSWSIAGAPGGVAPKTGSLDVRVESFDLPYDIIEVWAEGSYTLTMPVGSEHQWGNLTAGPSSVVIPLEADYAQYDYLFVWLVARTAGVMTVSGNPHDAGYDPRLMKLLRLT